MRAHSPEISLTEFLTKSLVTAGVFLAVPAALSVAIAAFMLFSAWPYSALSYLSWIAFCSAGFYLLAQSIRVVRYPERVRRPRLVWFFVSLYLSVIVAAGANHLWSSFQLARQGELRDWGGDAMDPEILVFPAFLLLIPTWAFVLSTTLCIRRKCA
jgi:hypothetical protein